MVRPFAQNFAMPHNLEKRFSEYRARRASEDIADEIKSAILSGQFRQGHRLPSERSLASEFKVSRLTIREALRVLQAKGLIFVKKGSTGGAFVQSGTDDDIASIVIDRLLLDGILPYHIIETRVVVERGIVKYAGENARPEDLARIERNLQETKSVLKAVTIKQAQEFVFKIIEFHGLLAQATHIPFLITFNRIVQEWGNRRLRYWFPTRSERISHHLEHTQILEAIKRKDADRAEALMERHIRDMAATIEKHSKE
jgi:GntR family transcriptional repressor for pyruvate dehydrogenase complex